MANRRRITGPVRPRWKCMVEGCPARGVWVPGPQADADKHYAQNHFRVLTEDEVAAARDRFFAKGAPRAS